MKRQSGFPKGWSESRVQRLLRQYENQTDEEAVAEDEAAFEKATVTAMKVPVALVPAVRRLLARHRRPTKRTQSARKRAARG